MTSSFALTTTRRRSPDAKIAMNKPREAHLIEKLKDLPPQRLAEVEDFVDFLRSRKGSRALVRASTKVAEPAFARIWDNDEDAAYDRL